MGKEEEDVAGRHYDDSSYISMLVCLFVLCVFLSVCLFVYSFSLFPFKGTSLMRVEYGVICLFVFAFVCSTYIYCTIISLPVERNSKGQSSRPAPLSYGNKQLRCYDEEVLRLTV